MATATVDLREQVGKQSTAAGALMVRGFLVNATNPKGLLFFLAVLPQFVVPTEPLLPQYLAVGVTMVVVDLIVMGLYTGLSVRLVNWLHRRASRPCSTACSPACSPRPPSCFRWCGGVPLPREDRLARHRGPCLRRVLPRHHPVHCRREITMRSREARESRG